MVRSVAEAGTVHTGTPWTREALRQFAHQHPDTLAAVEAAIPEGHWLVLTAGGRAGRYGIWGAHLVNASGEVARSGEHLSVTAALYDALRAGKVTA